MDCFLAQTLQFIRIDNSMYVCNIVPFRSIVRTRFQTTFSISLLFRPLYRMDMIESERFRILSRPRFEITSRVLITVSATLHADQSKLQR